MGKGGAGRGGYGKAQRSGNGRRTGPDARDMLHHVQKFRYLPKAVLGAYPASDGCPFYLGDADDEKSFFKKGFIATKALGPDSCEAFWRLGMAVALYASSCEVGGKAVVDNIDDAGVVGDKTGLKQLRALLRSPEGRDFLRACKTLNVGRDGNADRPEAKAAMKSYVTFLKDQEAPLRKAVSRTASFAAKVYQASMSLAEHMDLVACPRAWADAMQGGKNQPAPVQAWMKDPKDTAKLLTALTDSFMRKVGANKKPKAVKKAAADSSDEEEEKGEASGSEAPPAGGSDGSNGSESDGDEASGAEDAEEAETDSDSDMKRPLRKRSGGETGSGKAARAGDLRARKAPGAASGSGATAGGATHKRRRDSEGVGKAAASAPAAGEVSDGPHSEPKKVRRTRRVDGASLQEDGSFEATSKNVPAHDQEAKPTKEMQPMEQPTILISGAKLAQAVTKWGEEKRKEAITEVETALSTGPMSLGDVQEMFAGIPSPVLAAGGLSVWRRLVLDLTEDPGPAACEAYVRVLSSVLEQTGDLQRDNVSTADDSSALGTDPLVTTPDSSTKALAVDDPGGESCRAELPAMIGADAGSTAGEPPPAPVGEAGDNADAKEETTVVEEATPTPLGKVGENDAAKRAVPRPPPGPPPPQAFEEKQARRRRAQPIVLG